MSDKLWVPGQTELSGPQELLLPGGKSKESGPPEGPSEDIGSGTERVVSADVKPAAQEQAKNLRKFVESLKYPPRSIQVACPQCNSQVSSLVFPIQDYGANPELLNMFLSGQLDTLMCSSCGNALFVNFPILVHLPQKQFLGVVVPESRNSRTTPQALIGQLSTSFISKVPPPQRKGYMLTPKQFMSKERLHDTLWEFQGVTKEMRLRQQAQMVLLQKLMSVANEDGNLERLLEAESDLVDRNFVMQIGQMAQQTEAGQESLKNLQDLLQIILEGTEAGRQVQTQQLAVENIGGKIREGLENSDLAQILSDQWVEPGGREVVLAIVHSAPQKFGYEFLLELSLLIEEEDDVGRQESLEVMRTQIDSAIKALVNQQKLVQQNVYQASVSLISGAIESEDPATLLRGQMRLLKGPFMPVLMNMIGNAQQNQAHDVVQRLLHLRDVALEVQAETMDAEDCFLFQLITAKTVGDSRSLMERNQVLITDELLTKMNDMVNGLLENEMEGQAKKIRSLRGQMALMR